MNVWALMPVYNEADILAAMLNHYVGRGIRVYVLDNWSTDDSRHIASTFDADDVWIERFPSDKPTKYFEWGSILKRCEDLARANYMRADWFILTGADEYLQTPGGDGDLIKWFQRVDSAGYNALAFEIWHYSPHDDNFRAGIDDPVTYFKNYVIDELPPNVNSNAWKSSYRLDMTNLGGHDVLIPDKRVYPVKWVKRHYPIRGQAHGERKVFKERLPRFSPNEKAIGWHVQYNHLKRGDSFIK